MLSDEIKDINIEENKLNIIKQLIINEERKNLRTREKSNPEMVQLIKRIIESTVDREQ